MSDIEQEQEIPIEDLDLYEEDEEQDSPEFDIDEFEEF